MSERQIGLRRLLRAQGFSLWAIGTLALCIGLPFALRSFGERQHCLRGSPAVFGQIASSERLGVSAADPLPARRAARTDAMIALRHE